MDVFQAPAHNKAEKRKVALGSQMRKYGIFKLCSCLKCYGQTLTFINHLKTYLLSKWFTGSQLKSSLAVKPCVHFWLRIIESVYGALHFLLSHVMFSCLCINIESFKHLSLSSGNSCQTRTLKIYYQVWAFKLCFAVSVLYSIFKGKD